MQTVVVAGASTGFGPALAERLCAGGHRVFVTSRSPASCPVGEQRFTMLPLDVRSDSSVAACVSTVLDLAGSVDVLVNNAGYVHEGPLEEAGVAGLQAVFDTNFFGTVRMVHAVLPTMRARRRGRIVNLGSVAGLMPLPFYGAYGASKHALEGYTESLKHELLPLGIDVSLIEPAFYRTTSALHKQRTSGAIADYDPHRQRMLDALASQEAMAPLPDPVVDLLVRLVTNPRRNRLRHVLGKYTIDYWLRGICPEWIWDFWMRRYWRLD